MLIRTFRRYSNSRVPSKRPRTSRRYIAIAQLTLERLEGRALPAFITAPAYPADVQPYSVAAGDFDGDGDLDLATANQYPTSTTVSVLLGNGDGTFEPRIDYDSGYGLRSLVAVDFNRDGALDLAAVYGQVVLLLGNGDGTFQAPRTVSPGGGGLAVGDFNGDGLHDLAVSNDGVSVMLGNGDGTFGEPHNFGAGVDHVAVSVGDFNGDGYEDLATTNMDPDEYGVNVLLGNGDGTFGAVRGFAVGDQPMSLAVGDFNGDGTPDVATANYVTNNVSVLLGNGDGTFRTRVNYAVGFYPQSVDVGDWDGDGDLDLAATTGSNTVSILLGQGNGTFQAGGKFAVGAVPSSLAAGDFDGDGDLDLAAANTNTLSNSVSVLLGDGEGAFAAPRSYGVGLDPAGVAIGDFNEDGWDDLAVANYHGGKVSVLRNRGDGTFLTAVNYTISSSATAVAVGDFNNDGHQDLAVGGDALAVLLGRGDGTFQAANFFDGGRDVALGDFNNDGNLDLVTPTYVILGNGDGTFQASLYFWAGSDPFAVAVGDYNRDGQLDLAVSNYDAPYKVSVVLGNGDGSFQAPVHYGDPTLFSDVAVGDFNGDGALDLAVTNQFGYYDGTVSVFLGYGDGSFQAPSHYSPAGLGDPLSVAVSDFNGDGILDLALTAGAGFPSAPDTVSILQGRGDGTFLAAAGYNAAVTTRSVAVGDFNGDDWPDLAVANWEANTATVLLNEGISVTINQGGEQADPTADSTITFDVEFSEPVTDFDAADIDLSTSTVGGSLVPAVTGSGSVYTVTVTGMDGFGTVVASIPAGAAFVASGAPTRASTSTDNSVLFNNLAPTVTIDQSEGQLDPTISAPIVFDVHFNQAVMGLDAADFSFAGSTVGGELVAEVFGEGQDYTVTVTGMVGMGTIVISIHAGAAVNPLGTGNAASTSTDNTVVFDGILPSVTIDQAVGQADPTNVASITFDVKFSEIVTGFDASDVSLIGSTAGGTLLASVSGSGDTYTVTVTGMTSPGLVVVSIPAGVAADAAGNLNLASTSTDNSVEFVKSGTVSLDSAVYSVNLEDGTIRVTVSRTGGNEGEVKIHFATSDGTAHSGGLAADGQADYTPFSETLTWLDGEDGDKTFDIPILVDDLNEGKEIFTLALTPLTGSATLGITAATVEIAPSDGEGPGKYLDQDGDKYTIKLNGKTGSMLYFRTDPDGDRMGPIELIELTDTLPDPLKPKAVLVITVTKSKTSEDGGTVGLGAITGPGLKSISARKVNLNGAGILLDGYLGALTIGDITSGADITTLETTNSKQKTRINARAIGSDTAIRVGADISSLTATSFGAGSVQAPNIGVMTIKGDMAANVDVTGAIGVMTIKGDMSADVNVDGVDVEPTKKALTRLKVKGVVTGSDIFVNGDVGTVTVGAFRDSRLFAGYTGADDGTGTFHFPATVTAFKATGKTDGFQNSRVIATNLKSATITHLDSTNDENEFGFYVKKILGSVKVLGPTKFKYDATTPTPPLDDFGVRIVGPEN